MRAWARVGSNSAAATAWGIDAPARPVPDKVSRTGFTVERDSVGIRLQPGPLCGRVIKYRIAGVDFGAGLNAPAGKLSGHCFNHI